mmetsp:Transcript_4002/g.8665  ORF Transcript_4002/g.8665 Transcript_4002/m.8665 type:complete len:243 (-) Transcript_4002:773-1501(-)
MPAAIPLMLMSSASLSLGLSGSLRSLLRISTCRMLMGSMYGLRMASRRRSVGLLASSWVWPVTSRMALTVLVSLSRSWAPSSLPSASSTSTSSYSAAMRGSLLARIISIRSIVAWKKGHSRYICCSSPLRPCLMAMLMASPTPSHEGRMRRVWVQANCQGMARRLLMPAMSLRRLGREPMLRLPSSASGVACLKYLMKAGCFTTMSRYASQLVLDSRSMVSRHLAYLGGLGGLRVASSTAVE